MQRIDHEPNWRKMTLRKKNFPPAGSVYYEIEEKEKALVPTTLSCTAVLLDAHKYGTR